MKNINFTYILVFFLFFANSYAQSSENNSKPEDTKISIIVKDSKNKPVPGAIILFDNVRQKRWTNSKGIFKTKVSKLPQEISAFSPNIGIKKVSYNGKNNIVIIIKKGNDPLLIGDQNNKAVSSVQYWNIYDYMRGQVPGVNITPDNVITIRGYNTVNGNTTPLFIFNGIAVSKETFSRIVPNTIKSIKILKGTDTAIYGSRGANGVIIVETF